MRQGRVFNFDGIGSGFGAFFGVSRYGGNLLPSPVDFSALWNDDHNSLYAAHGLRCAGVDFCDFGMGHGRNGHFAPQHVRAVDVERILGAAGGFLRPVDAINALADEFAMIGGRPVIVSHLGAPSFHFRGVSRLENGVLDAHVSSATAEVAAQRVAEALARAAPLMIQVRGAGHYTTRCAEAALLGVICPEGMRHRVQAFGGFETFDGGDFAALSVNGEGGTGINGVATEMNSAGAAGSAVANFFGASQVQMISQRVQ